MTGEMKKNYEYAVIASDDYIYYSADWCYMQVCVYCYFASFQH